jgi:hypothetical protein
LRGAQPAAAAKADREATNGRSRAAVRLNEEIDPDRPLLPAIQVP